MEWCQCGHRREDHANGEGPCQKCEGTTYCSEFRPGPPPTDVSGKQPSSF